MVKKRVCLQGDLFLFIFSCQVKSYIYHNIDIIYGKTIKNPGGTFMKSYHIKNNIENLTLGS